MPKISRFFAVAVLSALLCGASFAQSSAGEATLDNLPVEKMAGEMLESIDFSKIIDAAAKGAEKAAADVAAGKVPSLEGLESSPEVKEMQTQMQQQAVKAVPQLVKAFAPLLSGLLQEMKQELVSGLR